MSKINKRKHVMNEKQWDDYYLPTKDQSIVKVLHGGGNNLHKVQTASGEEYLVSMPNKFRNNIWVRRGSYVVVEPIIEGVKVKAEIIKILNKESIKYYKLENIWPKEFDDDQKEEIKECDDICVNTNRVHITQYDSDSDSSEEDDRDSNEENESDSNEENESDSNEESENDSSEGNASDNNGIKNEHSSL